MDNPASESSNDSLDTAQAAGAFSSFLSGASQEESGAAAQAEVANESPEAAAERLLAEEAANQNQADEGEQEEGEAYDENKTVTVMIDGKKVDLTLAQVAEAKKGELRQQDYTRKTMETAEERKAAVAEKQAARAERDNYAQQLQNYVITSESILAEQEKALTDELLRSDPVEYMALERTFRQRQAQAVKAQQELQQIGQQRKHEQAQAAAEYQQEQLGMLRDKLPAFNDEAKAQEEFRRLKGYLASAPDLAFTEQEIAMLGDHRFAVLADKGQKYDALMARAKETAGKVQKAPPKVERPGVAQVAATDGRTKAMKQLESSGGSLRDAANVFAQFM